MKMKLGKLLVLGTLLIGSVSFAQEGGEEDGESRECRRMLKIANDAMSFTNYKEATTYFIKAENECNEFDSLNYERLASCALNMATSTEGDEQKAYIDTLLGAWDRAEAKGIYSKTNDMNRGYFILQSSNPDYHKADTVLNRGINKLGTEVNEQFLPLYYYNIYTLWYIELDEAVKANYKQRLIKEYFSLSTLIQDANFAPSTQESLTQFMRQVINTCEDILPEMPKFMSTLPENKDSKKALMLDMGSLLSELGCQKSDEFKNLVNTLYELDQEDPDVIALYLEAADDPRAKIDAYEKLLSNATTDEAKNKYRYEIALAYFQLNSYQTAYNKAKAVGGKHKGNALSIMGQCVAATAMNCGESTFERKSNYIYAVQLLEQAQANGASVGGLISSYKSRFPTAEECFDNGNPSSQSLSCWGVTVNPCQ